MCGFLGSFNYRVNEVKFNSALNLIKHRGPDNISSIIIDEIYFGHVRLSILDLDDRSNQPFEYLNRYLIIYNGEIYNYIELKTLLVKQGYTFATTSDTEVLVALYDYKKKDCLNDLDGMFSFAIWDKFEKKLFCARDRFGEKPFFYKREGSGFVFASEVKSILCLTNSNLYNKNAINFYLKSEKHIDEPLTFFDNIYTLPAGSYIETSIIGDFSIKQYYDINKNIEYLSTHDIAYGEAVSIFRDFFFQSVTLRLRSDVSVGASLSGGLDSSAVVGIAKSILPSYTTFSAVYPGRKFDESAWINEVVKFNLVKSVKIEPTLEQYFNEMKQVAWHHEMPLASSSNFLQWCINKTSRNNGVKVLLDGQGADEYLGGYKDFKYYAIWDLYNKGKLSDYIRERKSFKENFGEAEKLGKLHLLDPLLKVAGIKRKELKLYGATFKERMLYSLKHELPHLLRYADRNSMAHSVEVRLPFLDHKLVEFTLGLPNEYIYKNGRTKRIMRDALKEYLPEKIYNRTDKIGFAGPKEEWLADNRFKILNKSAINVLRDKGFDPSEDAWINVSLLNFFMAFDKYLIDN